MQLPATWQRGAGLAARAAPSTRLLARATAVAALLIFFALALDTARQMAITTDEPAHLAHSLAAQQTGTMPIPEMHTPLTYQLVGAMLRLEPDTPDMTRLDAWPTRNPFDIGYELVRRDDFDVQRAVWLGRLVVVFMGVLLGALVAGWTLALTRGHWPATAVVMLLYAISSNLLASSSLLTTDIAATFTYFLCAFMWWRYWRRPGVWRWLAAAVSLGLVLAAKLTGVLLLPVTLLQAYVYWRRDGRWWRPGLVWLSLLPVAALVLWAFYSFEVRDGLPMPAYWGAWALILREVNLSHPNFFLGAIESEGSWLYFPATVLLKTPLPVLALGVIAPAVALARRETRRTAVFVLLPAAALLAAAVVSRLNYGYRHVLPVVPFLLVVIGLALAPSWAWLRARPLARWALFLGLAWTTAAALIQHPDHLVYFNELAGGPARGYQYLGDSNVDWGQALDDLARYARRYEVETGRPLYYSYTGVAPPAAYGLDHPSIIEEVRAGQSDFTPANPAAGRYAINASDLQGVGLTLGALTEIDLFDWFRHRQPFTSFGNSIFVYDVPEQADGRWVAHCLVPGPLLSNDDAERLLGRTGLRHVAFDCDSAWVFPEDGAPGWYVLPRQDGGWWPEAYTASRPALTYSHRANAYGPDYAIYYWPGSDRLGDLLRSPGEPARGEPLLRQTAELLDYRAAGAEWVTLWRVAEATADPLSLQAHLREGEAVQVADGLGFSADQWQPGDWFLQRHRFDRPGEALETGLYNYATLQPLGPTVTLPAP